MSKLALNFHLFWQGALISYKALFRWLDPPKYLATKIIGPLNIMLFFTFLGKSITSNDPNFYVVGNAVQAAAFSGIYGVTFSISGDRWEGTLPYLFGTPANRLLMFIGRSVMHIIDGMLGIAIGLIWGMIIFKLDLSQTSPLALLATIIIVNFSTSGLGLLMGCFGLITRNVMLINNTVFFLLLVFSGANLEISKLPQWAQTFSQMLPMTRGLEAVRRIIAGASFADVRGLLAIEFLIGLGYILLGYGLFNWFERQAKQRGTLEAF